MFGLDLQGKVAIVTGGGRGIGKACAEALVKHGVHVVITGRQEAVLEQTAEELSSEGRVIPVTCDITDVSSYAKVERVLVEEFGTLDILVNNAGVVIDKPFLEMTDGEIDAIINTNLVGLMKFTKHFGRFLVAKGKGKVINIGSYDGLVGTPNLVVYGTSKGGVIQFTRMLAVEWARFGVQVNCICPGYIRTAMNEDLWSNEELTGKILRRIPLRRIGEPYEIGPLVVYLSSSDSDYMTGQSLVLDGGESIS